MAMKQRQGCLQLTGEISYLRVSGFNCSLLQGLSIALSWSSRRDKVTCSDALRDQWSLNDLSSKYISVMMPNVTVEDPMEAFPLEIRDLVARSNSCKVPKPNGYLDLHRTTDWPTCREALIIKSY
jgi:hypothetical protein